VSLEHVYWIGGGSGAGKSTVARRLAERYGLDYYSTDDAMAGHARRSTAADSPFLHDFIAMDMDQRWLLRDPGTMLETFHWFRGEGFGLIVEDLRDRPPVVAEGFRLLPHLVAPLLADRDHAVWLLPTPEFREAAFAGRGSMWEIAGRTSDPERALRNLLDRDRMFTDRLRDEVRGLHAIEVGVTTTAEELTGQVATTFHLV
jgi:hypothetical protein